MDGVNATAYVHEEGRRWLVLHLCPAAVPREFEWSVTATPLGTDVRIVASPALASLLRAAAEVVDQGDPAPEPLVCAAVSASHEEGTCVACGARLVRTGLDGWRHVAAGWGSGPRACDLAAPQVPVLDARRRAATPCSSTPS